MFYTWECFVTSLAEPIHNRTVVLCWKIT